MKNKDRLAIGIILIMFLVLAFGFFALSSGRNW